MTEEEKTDIPKSPSLVKLEMEHKIEMENNEQDNTWRSCCYDCNKNAVQFFVQVGIIFFVICFAIYKLITDTSEGAQTIYMSLLTLCLGLVSPQPTFKKNKKIK